VGKKSQIMIFGPQDFATPQPPGFCKLAPRILRKIMVHYTLECSPVFLFVLRWGRIKQKKIETELNSGS